MSFAAFRACCAAATNLCNFSCNKSAVALYFYRQISSFSGANLQLIQALL
jgi:hypothetical protein